MNPPPLPNPHSPYGATVSVSSPSANEKNWAVGAHLSAFAHSVLPILAFVIPLVIWLMKREESEFIEAQAKEALNFQISLWIWLALGTVAAFTLIGIPLALVIVVVAAIVNIVCPILGAIAVSNGQRYRYPLTLRLLS